MLNKSVMNFKLLSPLPQTESLLIFSLCFLVPVSHRLSYCRLTNSLPASSCHSLTPPVTIPGRSLLLPGLLRAMGTGHLVAAGKGKVTFDLHSLPTCLRKGQRYLICDNSQGYQEEDIPNAPLSLGHCPL